jgi:hypothetical protein
MQARRQRSDSNANPADIRPEKQISTRSNPRRRICSHEEQARLDSQHIPYGFDFEANGIRPKPAGGSILDVSLLKYGRNPIRNPDSLPGNINAYHRVPDRSGAHSGPVPLTGIGPHSIAPFPCSPLGSQFGPEAKLRCERGIGTASAPDVFNKSTVPNSGCLPVLPVLGPGFRGRF